jgi:hypothetical protein
MYQERETGLDREKRGESKKCDRMKGCVRYTVTKKTEPKKEIQTNRDKEIAVMRVFRFSLLSR